MFSFRSLRAGRGLALLALLCAAAVGCGSSGPPTLSGKVKHQGKEVNNGTLTFHGADGKRHETSVGPDGTYRLPNAPEGVFTVTVRTVAAQQAGKGPPPGVTAVGGGFTPTQVPAKYANAATSGVKVTLTRGQKTQDIELP